MCERSSFGRQSIYLSLWRALLTGPGPEKQLKTSLFIIDIKQMASGRMEMGSTNIFHYTDLLTGLLILKKTRDAVCICGIDEHIFQDLAKSLPSVQVCQLLQGNQPSRELWALFLFNFVGFTCCCYGHTVLRTKAKRAFFVGCEESLPATPGGKQTCQLSPHPNYETPRKTGSLVLQF